MPEELANTLFEIGSILYVLSWSLKSQNHNTAEFTIELKA